MSFKKTQSLPGRVIKYTLYTILGLIILIFGTIGIVLNTVFSPAKLTPIVLDQASGFLKPQLSTESVELTFFSSFPDFELHIRNGAIADSADTLIRFDEISASIRPLKFLTDNQIYVGNVLFKNASVKARIDSCGQANWDIVKENGDSLPADSSRQEQTPLPGIHIGKVSFEGVDLSFTDVRNGTFFDLDSLNSSLSGSFGKENSDLRLNLSIKNLLFVQEGKTLIDQLKLEVASDLSIDFAQRLCKIGKTTLGINGIQAGCAGTIQHDTVANTLITDMQVGLNIPSLADLLKLIPTSIVKEAADVKTTGEILILGSVKGIYGKDSFPVIEAKASIDKGSFHYKGLPYGVDLLDLYATGYLDMNQKKSDIEIERFLFKGASSELNIQGEINNILIDPAVRADIETKIDFTALSKTLPFDEKVVMQGTIDSKLRGNFELSSIRQADYGKIDLQGFLKISDIKLESPADSFLLDVRSAGFAFGANQSDKTILQGKNLLNAVVGFDGLTLDSRLGKASMDSVRLHVKSSPLKDTTAIVSMDASISLKNLTAISPDSMGIYLGPSKIALGISPSIADKKIPLIKSSLKFDTLCVHDAANVLQMRTAGFELKSIKGKEYKKQWISEGRIGFKALSLWMKAFPIPVSMPASLLSLTSDELHLQNASVRIGNSDIALNGKFTNLKKTFFEGGILKGEYALNSSFIDCNEIIHALQAAPVDESVKGSMTDEKLTVSEPADSLSVFVVPDKIDFVLHSKIDKVQLGQMVIERINGDILLRNQTIELDGINMHTLAADMNSTLVYKASNAQSAYTGFDIRMKDIQVGKLVELMPALDTLVPMLRSLDGIVNFHIAAETRLKQDMTPDVSSVQAAVNLRGDSLVLMDGQTFTEISKMLRFKNKNRNVIDSVSVDMIVRNGQIEIYPFRITMDRYMAAVGGKHNLDMSFNYHVSLLESPIPFKVGVDIKGNMDDFKFRITKPKYKDMRTAVRSSPVDSTSHSLRERLKHIVEDK